MKRPNVDRMRRHQARTCPDQISRTFVRSYPDSILGWREWFESFKRKMEIKHPNKAGEIEASSIESLDASKVVITLRWRPR